MRRIVTFSGGKDSQAVAILVAKKHSKYELVFCDTNWEAPETIAFLDYYESKTNKSIIRIKSSKYNGVIDLAKKSSRFPSSQARYCTEKLKVVPQIDYILDNVREDCTIYQGIRHEESRNRATMNKHDDYFRYYFEPYKYDKHGKPVYHTYRKKDVVGHLEKWDVHVTRPIITWTTKQVFEFIRESGFAWNELYNMGYNRVGCFPCIMCSHGEVINMIRERPERLEEIAQYEKELDSTFFPPGYIPERFCTKVVKTKKGELKKVPTIEDVTTYLEMRRGKYDLFSGASCKNNYVQCE